MDIHIIVGDSNEQLHIDHDNVYFHSTTGSIDDEIVRVINSLNTSRKHVIGKDSSV